MLRYLALACDYDGTIATGGGVTQKTLAALERVPASGRKLILVTGRQLDDLQSVFPRLDLFERIVAENGALLYRPASKETRVLGEPPPKDFIQKLRERVIDPLSVGRVIVATWEPHETTVLEVIRELGLEWQVIFNKGAVMALPSGVNKGTGLTAALEELGLSPHNVVGIGDAENDHAFLSMCECAVAVSNALPPVQQRADVVTQKASGAGTVELIERLLADDLRELGKNLTRHHILLGTTEDGKEFCVNPHGTNVLIAGSSGSGKSTVTAGLLERFVDKGYQFCIVDPEGDYESFEGAVVLGDRKHPPGAEELFQLLAKPASNAVLNLLGIPLQDRPAFFAGLIPRLQDLRTRTGRPHCLVLDEAHHLLRESKEPASMAMQKIEGMVFITVHPDQIAPAILEAIGLLVVVGKSPEATVKAFTDALGRPAPAIAHRMVETGEALVWALRQGGDPVRITIAPPRADHRRHRRKYAEGELGPDNSFYFRGPEGKLNLRAQNLMLFMQLADGIDDETWTFHFRAGDYSKWFQDKIKNAELAEEARQIEAATLPPKDAKARMRAAIEARYTLPATGTLPPVAGRPPKSA